MTGKKFPLEKTEGEILIRICIPLSFVIKETVTFEKYIILQIKAPFFFRNCSLLLAFLTSLKILKATTDKAAIDDHPLDLFVSEQQAQEIQGGYTQLLMSVE